MVLLTTEAEDIHVTEGGDGPFRVGVIGNGFRTGFIVLSALQGKPIVSGLVAVCITGVQQIGPGGGQGEVHNGGILAVLRCSDEVAVGIKELEPGIESTGHRAHANNYFVTSLPRKGVDVHLSDGADRSFEILVVMDWLSAQAARETTNEQQSS